MWKDRDIGKSGNREIGSSPRSRDIAVIARNRKGKARRKRQRIDRGNREIGGREEAGNSGKLRLFIGFENLIRACGKEEANHLVCLRLKVPKQLKSLRVP